MKILHPGTSDNKNPYNNLNESIKLDDILDEKTFSIDQVELSKTCLSLHSGLENIKQAFQNYHTKVYGSNIEQETQETHGKHIHQTQSVLNAELSRNLAELFPNLIRNVEVLREIHSNARSRILHQVPKRISESFSLPLDSFPLVPNYLLHTPHLISSFHTLETELSDHREMSQFALGCSDEEVFLAHLRTAVLHKLINSFILSQLSRTSPVKSAADHLFSKAQMNSAHKNLHSLRDLNAESDYIVEQLVNSIHSFNKTLFHQASVQPIDNNRKTHSDNTKEKEIIIRLSKEQMSQKMSTFKSAGLSNYNSTNEMSQIYFPDHPLIPALAERLRSLISCSSSKEPPSHPLSSLTAPSLSFFDEKNQSNEINQKEKDDQSLGSNLSGSLPTHYNSCGSCRAAYFKVQQTLWSILGDGSMALRLPEAPSHPISSGEQSRHNPMEETCTDGTSMFNTIERHPRNKEEKNQKENEKEKETLSLFVPFKSLLKENEMSDCPKLTAKSIEISDLQEVNHVTNHNEGIIFNVPIMEFIELIRQKITQQMKISGDEFLLPLHTTEEDQHRKPHAEVEGNTPSYNRDGWLISHLPSVHSPSLLAPSPHVYVPRQVLHSEGGEAARESQAVQNPLHEVRTVGLDLEFEAEHPPLAFDQLAFPPINSPSASPILLTEHRHAAESNFISDESLANQPVSSARFQNSGQRSLQASLSPTWESPHLQSSTEILPQSGKLSVHQPVLYHAHAKYFSSQKENKKDTAMTLSTSMKSHSIVMRRSMSVSLPPRPHLHTFFLSAPNQLCLKNRSTHPTLISTITGTLSDYSFKNASSSILGCGDRLLRAKNGDEGLYRSQKSFNSTKSMQLSNFLKQIQLQLELCKIEFLTKNILQPQSQQALSKKETFPMADNRKKLNQGKNLGFPKAALRLLQLCRIPINPALSSLMLPVRHGLLLQMKMLAAPGIIDQTIDDDISFPSSKEDFPSLLSHTSLVCPISCDTASAQIASIPNIHPSAGASQQGSVSNSTFNSSSLLNEDSEQNRNLMNIIPCGHICCSTCLQKISNKSGPVRNNIESHKCPVCRTKFSTNQVKIIKLFI